MLATHGGAKHWDEVNLGGPVVAMVSGAGEAYAAVSRCSPASPCAGPGQLYRSPIGGNSWAEAPGLPGQFDVEAG